MRRLLVLLPLAAAFATPAHASPYCGDLGPVPGYGPVCVVECVLGTHPVVNPTDVRETLGSLIVTCPA